MRSISSSSGLSREEHGQGVLPVLLGETVADGVFEERYLLVSASDPEPAHCSKGLLITCMVTSNGDRHLDSWD